MEKRITYKVKQFKAAILNFEESLSINLNDFPSIVIDSLKSGRVQKYEFCVELLWKTIKVFLYEINGLDCKSPRQTIKEFYNLGYVSSKDFEKLLEILDDRNQLSHIYNKDQFNEIYNRIVNCLYVFKIVLKEIE